MILAENGNWKVFAESEIQQKTERIIENVCFEIFLRK
jgi:hypothetical protein